MSVELKNWKELCKEKDERIKELEGKFDEILERLEEEKTKKYKDWNRTSHFQDLGGYRECEHIIDIVKKVGGMND